METGDAWHFLITHCRNLEVRCGSARVHITVSDEGWRTELRDGDRKETASGTHTHDLLTYLAYLPRPAEPAVHLGQGQPFEASEPLWVSHSATNASVSTADGGRRLHIYNEAGAESILSLLQFRPDQP